MSDEERRILLMLAHEVIIGREVAPAAVRAELESLVLTVLDEMRNKGDHDE